MMKKSNLLKIAFSLFSFVIVFLLLKGLDSRENRLNNARAVTYGTFTASEDAFVKSSAPSSKFGSAKELQVQRDARTMNSLIRFVVDSLPTDAIINRVTLKLYVPSNGSKIGGDIKSVTGAWNESSVTWATAPAVGEKLASMPNPVKSGVWSLTDLPTSFVQGNGIFNLYITTPSTNDAVYYASRESGKGPILEVAWTSVVPTPASTPSETPIPPPASGANPVVIAAGDIACDPGSTSFNEGRGTASTCRMQATADIINSENPDAVLVLGDIQYYCGSLSAFNASYNLSWGVFKSKTYPAVGNHEYLTSGGTGCDSTNSGAAGYFNYFGSKAGEPTKGYYSYDIGKWHVIVVNSNCGEAGGCGVGTPQYNWVKSELETHNNACTLAYWHIPLYSSGGRSSPNTHKIYQLLYDYNADLVLAGHDHTYERFAPQNANGVLDTQRGIREFVVGTGGANHTSLATRQPNSEVFNADTFGVLKLTLHPTSYDWQFKPEAGKIFSDSGTAVCH